MNESDAAEDNGGNADKKRPYCKTVVIHAEPGKRYRKVKKQRQVGTRTVEKRIGVMEHATKRVDEPIFEEYEETVEDTNPSRTHVDLTDLAQRIANAVERFHEMGYRVLHISEINRGVFESEIWEGQNVANLNRTWGAGWGYGYGYSVTHGVIITAVLRDPDFV